MSDGTQVRRLTPRECEDVLNDRRVPLGKDPVWLTRFNKRLSDAVRVAQDELPWDGAFNDGFCDEGYCWT